MQLVQLLGQDEKAAKKTTTWAAKEIAEKKQLAGEEMHNMSVRGMVSQNLLSDLGELETATVQEKQGQHCNKQFVALF